MFSQDLQKLRSLSTSTLNKVVTNDGIYASTALGAEGMYHGFFGRDTAITAYLIAQAENLQNEPLFLNKAAKGLLQMMTWQSKSDNLDTGEEAGKFPHEIRVNEQDYQHLTKGMLDQGKRSWYVDPADKVLKNWDTNDATQLWIIVVARLHEKGMIELTEEVRSALRHGLLWCVRNLRDHDGLAGFRYNPDRTWSGVINQTWKDSDGAYIHTDGTEPAKPIKDVFVNALTWSALRYGSKLFATYDHDFATFLKKQADELKTRFNDPKTGFLMEDQKSGYYFAEAIDNNGRQLQAVSCDPGLVLWAYCDNESVIDNKYIPSVAKRLLQADMLDPNAGIRTYSCEGTVYDYVAYHRGPNTFWPFVSGLIADGLNNFGYKYEAKEVLSAMVKGVKSFGSCIELFIKKEEAYSPFSHPDYNQLSCTDQAWTAGALYYATNYLQNG
jgi:glycogen debranching enzyme